MGEAKTVFVDRCSRCGKAFRLGHEFGLADGRPVCIDCKTKILLSGDACRVCGAKVTSSLDEMTFLVAPRREDMDFTDWGGGANVTAFEVPMMVCPKCHSVFQTEAQHTRLQRVKLAREVETAYKLE